MAGEILYLGDTHLRDAAKYLTGVMTHFGMSFDYLPSDQACALEAVQAERRLFVISDYPAAQMAPAVQAAVVDAVSAGAGLLMIGGWESYRGLAGHWNGSEVAGILPVRLGKEDDRQNCDQPVLVRDVVPHEVLDGLPWADRPPVIGGYNRFEVMPGGDRLLAAQRYHAVLQGESFRFDLAGEDPLLVVGRHGHGRVACLATDVAPHWVGPLVDWGSPRITAQAPGSDEIEVGCFYAQFLRQLLTWTGELG